MGLLEKLSPNYGSFENAITIIGEKTLDNYCNKIYKYFCNEFENSHYLKTFEWHLRHYSSAKKMVLSALFFKQTQYLESHKLKNLTLYTCYYCLYNAFASNLILLPYLKIKQIIKISHSQVFKDIENYFVKSKIYSTEYLQLLNILKSGRELYSYHLPLENTFLENIRADSESYFIEKLTKVLPVILQISNIISFMSYFAWKKKVSPLVDEYHKYQYECDQLFFSFIQHEDFFGSKFFLDDGDWYLQGQLISYGGFMPIKWFVGDKMCEHLACSWENFESDYGFDIESVEDYLVNILI